jgi:hypothetical protein
MSSRNCSVKRSSLNGDLHVELGGTLQDRLVSELRLRGLLDGRVVVLHDDVIRGDAPAPGPLFVLKPRRAPSGEVLDLLENETGMHSCLDSHQASPVGAGGKRRHPRGEQNTGLGADKPEAQ